MKVLLRRNVSKLGQIGDVVEVRDGYARNFLIPQGLAVIPSEGNIRAVEREKEAYLAELARRRAELETQAKLLQGKEFTITARANEEGHLYGSVGPAQIAAAIGKDGILIEPEQILLDEPIRRLDKYEIAVRFAEDVEAGIVLWVVPPRDAGEGITQEGPAEQDQPEAGPAPDSEGGPEEQAQQASG